MNLTYCDYIATMIRDKLNLCVLDEEVDIVRDVGPVKMNLHETEGWLIDTKKTINVTDRNGKTYRVTVEEV